MSRLYSCLLAALCAMISFQLAACAEAPEVKFGAAPTETHWPVVWRSQEGIDREYPLVAPPFEEDKDIAGKKFSEERLRVRDADIARLNKLALFGGDGKGLGFVRTFLIAKEAGNLRIKVEEVAPSYEQATTMLCDRSFRLLDYSSKRIRRSPKGDKTNFIVCKWETGEARRNGYRLTTGRGDKLFRTPEPLVPEDLAYLYGSFTPSAPFVADFRIFSPAFRGVYGCEVRTRQRKNAKGAERIVQVFPRSPLGRRTWLVFDAKNTMLSGYDQSGYRLFSTSVADAERLRKLYRLRLNEWDAMLFNGDALYSTLKSGGDSLSAEERSNPKASWFSVPGKPLDLVVSPEETFRSAVIAHLTNSDTLARHKRAVAERDESRVGGSGVNLRADERHLVVLLEMKPSGQSLKAFAQGAASVETGKERVESYQESALTISGYPAYRYEYVLRRTGRQGARRVTLPPMFQSVVMIDVKGVILRVVISIGSDWNSYLPKVREIQKGIRVGQLPKLMHGTK